MPVTEEEEPQLYIKDVGAAGIHGQIFEYKFCALVFLRALNKRYNFKLASNVKGLGAFDDVVIEYLDEKSRKSHIFLQLKSKVRRKITMSKLKAKEGDFSLRKYYESYLQVEKNFNCSAVGVKMDGSIDESLFIIYSNADVGPGLSSIKVNEDCEEFLLTDGHVLRFNEEAHKTIYQHLRDLPKHREFLSRFRIFYRQADEKRMDLYIKPELQKSMRIPEYELDIACMCFIDFMKDWWQNENFVLKDTNSRKNNPLLKTSEKLRPILVGKLLDQRKSELDKLSIKYKPLAIADMKQLIKTHKSVLIFAPGISTTLTTAKIHQTLSATKYVILNLQQLIRYNTDVILAWRSVFDVLVLESGGSAEVSPDYFNELSGFLNESVAEKKLIFISNSVGNIQQIHELRSAFQTNLTEEYDDCKLTDIDTQSRMLFLDRKVDFQGVELELSKIVKNDDVRLLHTLDSDSISLLIENVKPSIGVSSVATVKYYIDRTLQFRKQAVTSLPTQGEIQPASRGKILQEMRDIFPHLEENMERGSAIYWKPRTLLEGDGQIILVTNEPGMGKSTLLSHLAKETRICQPDIWIVRVNINNYTRILEELKTNGCDEKGAIKLLTEAAEIKETGGVVLEGRLFNYCYNSTGNMAVLIDGVDEVSPHYTEQIIQVLKILSKTKIKRIWVTSRNSVKDRLETEFQCQSYSLEPFSEEDQKRFLVKFWKETYPEIEDDYLDNLANRVVKLSTEQLTVEDKKFMGIPLQSLLLAEMFEGKLKEYSTSKIVKLPGHINVIVFYDLYVEKKWDIYLQDKKGSDKLNVMTHNDNAVLHKKFIHNHMAAALLAILSTQQLEKLTDKTIAERAREFVHKIKEGVEKTGIIIDVIEGRPVFQHRTLAEFLVARWLCCNFQNGQTFMRDHLFEAGFRVVRSMVERILADKCILHEAVLNSSLIHVEKLLQKKGSITKNDRGGRTPLHVAVSSRSPIVVQMLLEHGADVSSLDNLLVWSPVQYAIGIADWEMLSLLMEKRPDVREQVLNGTIRDCTDNIACAFRAAAEYGHNDLLKYLISKGNSVKVALPRENSTLIHVAARCQQTEILRMLLLQGASIDCHDESGKTPLHLSVETGNLEVIKCLVEHQETVQTEIELQHVVNTERTVKRRNFLNVPDVDGNTALHLGVETGNIDIVSYLVRAGSDLNTCNVQGDYPLSLAVRCGKNDIVELLMKTEVKSDEGKIGTLRAVIVAGDVEATDLLLRLGVPVNIGNNEKPIHLASRLGREEIIKMLLQYGASLTSRTDKGNTALHLASEAGHMNLVKHLVKEDRRGMCSLNFENETPLHLAARNGRDWLVKYFAENGCNFNSVSANGATCLHLACENGHYTTVECLLKYGAKVNAINSANQTPLHIAADRGQTKFVEMLTQHNANFSLRDKDGITALLAASMKGHQDTVLLILQHGGNIEDTDRNGNTIAHFAVRNENIDILNFLSQRNVSLDVQNSDGDTPLLQAVREGRNRMVQYLVERNCDINTQDKDGMWPLDIAVLHCKMKTTRILLERNASSGKKNMRMVASARFGFVDLLQGFVAMGDDINVKADHGESLLHVASKYGHIATVHCLCEHGAVLDWQDNNGNTALHVAAEVGSKEICRILLNGGAGVNAEDKNTNTSFILASEKWGVEIVEEPLTATALYSPLSAATERQTEVVQEFLNNGESANRANETGAKRLRGAAEKCYEEVVAKVRSRCATVDITNAYGSTPLMSAAANGHVEVGIELLDCGARINSRDTHFRTPLSVAAAEGNVEFVTELLNRGATVHTTDKYGSTPLSEAAANGHLEVVTELLNRGAATEFRGKFAGTPLSVAAGKGHLKVVTELLNRGARVDSKGFRDSTPLMVAAAVGHVEVVAELLNRGARVDSTDKYGRTPLILATLQGHVDVVTKLLNHGATVDITDVNRRTPLSKAAENGHVRVVTTLLNHGARVESADKYGITPLIAAAANGHIEIVAELLNRGAAVHFRGKFAGTPLIVAAEKGHLEIVKEMLNQCAAVDSTDYKGRKPLIVAAAEGHREVVTELLNRGATVNSRDKYDSTPLSEAAAKGHVEVVIELLNRGASVDSTDKNGRTPLILATVQGHLEVVTALLNRDARVDSTDKCGSTPLSEAAAKGHLEVVIELLNHGARVDNADKYGRTPLVMAAVQGYVKVVTELLNRDASLQSTDKYGNTALSEASAKGHLEVVTELLNRGARVDSTDKYGRTPLVLAAVKGNLEVVTELLNRGATVDSIDKFSSTPLSAAAAKGHVEIVTELLNRGANLDSTDKYSSTPLSAAAAKGHVEVVRALLNRGAIVDSTDFRDSTPLRVAAAEGHVEVVTELLNRGATVDSRDKYGSTPLNEAATKGHLEVVTELLNHGARVSIADKNGRTPLRLAATNGHLEVVTVLMDRGAKVNITFLFRQETSQFYSSIRTRKSLTKLLNIGSKVDSTDTYSRTPL